MNWIVCRCVFDGNVRRESLPHFRRETFIFYQFLWSFVLPLWESANEETGYLVFILHNISPE